jgi:hypothetical protein
VKSLMAKFLKKSFQGTKGTYFMALSNVVLSPATPPPPRTGIEADLVAYYASLTTKELALSPLRRGGTVAVIDESEDQKNKNELQAVLQTFAPRLLLAALFHLSSPERAIRERALALIMRLASSPLVGGEEKQQLMLSSPHRAAISTFQTVFAADSGSTAIVSASIISEVLAETFGCDLALGFVEATLESVDLCRSSLEKRWLVLCCKPWLSYLSLYHLSEAERTNLFGKMLSLCEQMASTELIDDCLALWASLATAKKFRQSEVQGGMSRNMKIALSYLLPSAVMVAHKEMVGRIMLAIYRYDGNATAYLLARYLTFEGWKENNNFKSAKRSLAGSIVAANRKKPFFEREPEEERERVPPTPAVTGLSEEAGPESTPQAPTSTSTTEPAPPTGGSDFEIPATPSDALEVSAAEVTATAALEQSDSTQSVTAAGVEPGTGETQEASEMQETQESQEMQEAPVLEEVEVKDVAAEEAAAPAPVSMPPVSKTLVPAEMMGDLISAVVDIMVSLLADSCGSFLPHAGSIINYCLLNLHCDPLSGALPSGSIKQLLALLLQSLLPMAAEGGWEHSLQTLQLLASVVGLERFALDWSEATQGKGLLYQSQPPISVSPKVDGQVDVVQCICGFVRALGQPFPDQLEQWGRECLEWASYCSDTALSTKALIIFRYVLHPVDGTLLLRLSQILNDSVHAVQQALCRSASAGGGERTRGGGGAMASLLASTTIMNAGESSLRACMALHCLQATAEGWQEAGELAAHPELFWLVAACTVSWAPVYGAAYRAAIRLLAWLASRPGLMNTVATEEASPAGYALANFEAWSSDWKPAFPGLLSAILPGICDAEVQSDARQLVCLMSEWKRSELVTDDVQRMLMTMASLLPWLLKELENGRLHNAPVGYDAPAYAAHRLSMFAARRQDGNSPVLEDIFRHYAQGRFVDNPELFEKVICVELATRYFPSQAPMVGSMYRHFYQHGPRSLRPYVLRLCATFLRVSGAESWVSHFDGLIVLAGQRRDEGSVLVLGAAACAGTKRGDSLQMDATTNATGLQLSRSSASSLTDDLKAAQSALLHLVVRIRAVTGPVISTTSSVASQSSDGRPVLQTESVMAAEQHAYVAQPQPSPIRAILRQEENGEMPLSPIFQQPAPRDSRKKLAPLTNSATNSPRPAVYPLARATTEDLEEGEVEGFRDSTNQGEPESITVPSNVEPPSLAQLLHDPKLLPYFKSYVSRHMDSDELNFYISAREYMHESSVARATLKAKVIITRFVSLESFDTVNIDDATRRSILRLYEENLPGPPPTNLFQQACNEVKTTLARDVYPLFLKSKEYNEMMKAVPSMWTY